MTLSINIHKKMSLLFILGLILSLLVGNTAFASGKDSVYDSYQKDSKQTEIQDTSNSEVIIEETPSFFSLIIKFIFSLLLVIALIWGFLKFLGKKTGQLHTKGPIKVIGGQNLGNNRSVQVTMIGDNLYILGVGNDIQVVDKIMDKEEQEKILQGFNQYKEAYSQINKNTKLGNMIVGYTDTLKGKIPTINKNDSSKFEKVLYEKIESTNTEKQDKEGENK